MLNAKAESTTYKLMTDADVSYNTTEHDTVLHGLMVRKFMPSLKSGLIKR